jgi:hypothetical protein
LWQVLSCLAKAGADLHKPDKFGDNVLHHATRRNVPLAHLQMLVQDFKVPLAPIEKRTEIGGLA